MAMLHESSTSGRAGAGVVSSTPVLGGPPSSKRARTDSTPTPTTASSADFGHHHGGALGSGTTAPSVRYGYDDHQPTQHMSHRQPPDNRTRSPHRIRARRGYYTRSSALMRAQSTQSARFLAFFQK
ncbi:BZ3500_MvSof-1268-A1-R1_Chr5-3g08296 [Microbotryum saponariae]|uniref:BZ3500_MvSof-1268-A1-R1_Chr5-3g08296 protein n=1 Tax=Microbotryum saponariae TaxID=289078 RepID=A0A2X0KJZ4_9BASI|nr:BZ3500_MvSof-1268-A1-R1_Chr5-3g08296 [Microbotryum saponariae]SDA08404.1 BZ3501_MvSof-1269-A2-R1_Chr5-3g08024 [Microbotryum saponariae]